MNKPKSRGRFVENWIRDKHIENGIQCERVPLSGSMGGLYTGDLAMQFLPLLTENSLVRAKQEEMGKDLKSLRTG
jgi:hypothetical protein